MAVNYGDHKHPDHVPYYATCVKTSHSGAPAFIHVSGGVGHTDEPEVHLKVHDDHGGLIQGWFKVSDLLDAVAKYEGGGHEDF